MLCSRASPCINRWPFGRRRLPSDIDSPCVNGHATASASARDAEQLLFSVAEASHDAQMHADDPVRAQSSEAAAYSTAMKVPGSATLTEADPRNFHNMHQQASSGELAVVDNPSQPLGRSVACGGTAAIADMHSTATSASNTDGMVPGFKPLDAQPESGRPAAPLLRWAMVSAVTQARCYAATEARDMPVRQANRAEAAASAVNASSSTGKPN